MPPILGHLCLHLSALEASVRVTGMFWMFFIVHSKPFRLVSRGAPRVLEAGGRWGVLLTIKMGTCWV